VTAAATPPPDDINTEIDGFAYVPGTPAL